MAIYKRRAKTRNLEERQIIRNWQGALQGFPAFLVGNGPSLDSVEDIHLLDGYFSIGINRPFRKDGFDPTILLWQDIELWKQEKKTLRKLKALKFCRNVCDPEQMAMHFKLRGGPFLLPKNPSVLYGSGATGPLAFQIAYTMGCDPIVLLGFDCKYKGKKTNFYGVNKDHKPHTLDKCMHGLRWIKGWHDREKVTTINCSAVNVYKEQKTLPEALDIVQKTCGDKGKAYNRKFFLKVLVPKKKSV